MLPNKLPRKIQPHRLHADESPRKGDWYRDSDGRTWEHDGTDFVQVYKFLPLGREIKPPKDNDA